MRGLPYGLPQSSPNLLRSGGLWGLLYGLPQSPPSWLRSGRLRGLWCDLQNFSLEAWSWLLIGRLVPNGRLVQNASLEPRPCSLSDRWIHNGRLLWGSKYSSPPAWSWLLSGRLVRNGRLVQNASLELRPRSLGDRWIHNGRLSLWGWRDICIRAWSRWRVGRLFRTNSSCPCARPSVFDGCAGNGFLGLLCCLFGFLDNSCLWFLFAGWRWRWRWNGRLGTLPVSEELVVAPSCVGGIS